MYLYTYTFSPTICCAPLRTWTQRREHLLLFFQQKCKLFPVKWNTFILFQVKHSTKKNYRWQFPFLFSAKKREFFKGTKLENEFALLHFNCFLIYFQRFKLFVHCILLRPCECMLKKALFRTIKKKNLKRFFSSNKQKMMV